MYMEKQTQTQSQGLGLQDWEARVNELASIRDSLRSAYALISDMHAYAIEQVSALTPDREEVVNG